ncbi:MAG TPA: polysaccharide biosynthesis C-terminal domain-containing protein [Agriterribacter sp.]|nr:polysaccharide biosynthesis C-terminal domain-containing protein [Agriterribacter sp.]
MTLVNLVLIALVPLSNGILVDRTQYINIYFGGFLAQGALLGICFVLVNKGIWKLIFPSYETLAQIFRYAFQAFVANLIFFLLCRIDYWFVEKYCSANDLGNYIQVSKLVQMFIVIPAIMASIIFPISAGGDKNSVRESISLFSRMIIALYTLASLVFIAAGYWLFPFIYGSTFTNMYIPYLLLIPGIFFLSMLTLLGAHFAGQNKVRLNIVYSAIGLVVIITGDIILIPIYGIIAAAFVSSAGYFLCLVFLMRIFIQQNHLTLKDILILKQKDLVGIRTWFLQKRQ